MAAPRVDRLTGGSGDDLFVVTAGHVLVELADGGIDTIRTTAAALVLGAFFENAVAASTAAHLFTGNTLAMR